MNAIFFILILSCLCSTGASAQNNDPSSIVSKSAILSEEEINQLLNETNEIRTSDLTNFVLNLNKLEELKEKFTKTQYCLYRFLSAYKIALGGNVQNSIDQLLNIKADCDYVSINVRIESLLANIYAISGEYQNALTTLDSALTRVESIDDENLVVLVFKTAFVVYDLVSQNQLSLDFAQIVLDRNPSPRIKCSASVYKHISMIKLNQVTFEEEKIDEVVHSCRRYDENIAAEALNVNWINYQLEKATTHNEIELIYQSLVSSIDSIMATQYKNLIVFTDSLMAKTLELLGRQKEAAEYAERALEGTKSLGDSQQKIDALQVLYSHYQKNGDFELANEYLVEKNLAESGFYSDKQEKLMAYQTIKHDNLAKVNQIEFLNQQNNMLNLEKELAEKSKDNQLLLIYLFASLIIFLLYIGYRIKKQQDMYKSLSEMDYMTKIYNRKGIKDYMEYLLPYSNKKNETIAFGVFDLDKFKKINDQYGHSVGDWVIKSTIKACKQLNNEKATFARLGGEEFAMILRDSNLSEIIEFSEQCRSAINAIETLNKTGQEFQISASFGITTTKISGYDFSNLMNHADNALYESKENGRNKVTVFNPMSQQVIAQDSV